MEGLTWGSSIQQHIRVPCSFLKSQHNAHAHALEAPALHMAAGIDDFIVDDLYKEVAALYNGSRRTALSRCVVHVRTSWLPQCRSGLSCQPPPGPPNPMDCLDDRHVVLKETQEPRTIKRISVLYTSSVDHLARVHWDMVIHRQLKHFNVGTPPDVGPLLCKDPCRRRCRQVLRGCRVNAWQILQLHRAYMGGADLYQAWDYMPTDLRWVVESRQPLSIMHCKYLLFQVGSRGLLVVAGARVACCVLRVACCVLRVACCVLRGCLCAANYRVFALHRSWWD